MKNNISFFRHDSNAHNESGHKYLRHRFGWTGEGRFWALCGEIAKQENCMLDLNKKAHLMSASSTLEMEFDEFKEFVDHCIECELLFLDDGLIRSIYVDESAEVVNKRRERNKRYYDSKATTEEKPVSPVKPKKPKRPKKDPEAEAKRNKLILLNCKEAFISEESESFLIAKKFHELFIKFHGKNKLTLNSAKYSKWVDTVTAMKKLDKRTIDEFNKVYLFMNKSIGTKNDFWITTVMAVSGIRNNFDKILSEAERIKTKGKDKPKFKNESVNEYSNKL